MTKPIRAVLDMVTVGGLVWTAYRSVVGGSVIDNLAIGRPEYAGLFAGFVFALILMHWPFVHGWLTRRPREFKKLVPLMERCRDGLSTVRSPGIEDKSTEKSQVDELSSILSRRFKIWWPFIKGEAVAFPASNYYDRCLRLLRYAREGDVKGAQREWPKPQAPGTGGPQC